MLHSYHPGRMITSYDQSTNRLDLRLAERCTKRLDLCPDPSTSRRPQLRVGWSRFAVALTSASNPNLGSQTRFSGFDVQLVWHGESPKLSSDRLQ